MTEGTYEMGEEIQINMDVYNLTIAANMNKSCTPVQLVFCLRYCIIVFLIQILLAFYFCFAFLDLDNF